MRPRQAGWRSARFAESAPQPVRHETTVAQPQPVRVPQPARPSRAPAVRAFTAGTIRDLLSNGNWSLSFIGVLAYVFAAVTYALPIVAPSIVIALLGLAFERTRITVPLFVVVFALFTAWSAFGLTSSIQPNKTTDELIVMGKVLLIVFVLAQCYAFGGNRLPGVELAIASSSSLMSAPMSPNKGVDR